jgi:hypothetical protein
MPRHYPLSISTQAALARNVKELFDFAALQVALEEIEETEPPVLIERVAQYDCQHDVRDRMGGAACVKCGMTRAQLRDEQLTRDRLNPDIEGMLGLYDQEEAY